jgi:hypothetical protein
MKPSAKIMALQKTINEAEQNSIKKPLKLC